MTDPMRDRGRARWPETDLCGREKNNPMEKEKLNVRRRGNLRIAVAVTVTAAVAAFAVLAVTAAAARQGKTINVNVGLKTPIHLTLPMKLGVFTSADCASYGAAEDAWMKNYAKAHHLNMTLVDSCFDKAKQFQQIQSAIAAKTYNTIATLPVDGQTLCHLAGTQAAKANVLMAVYDQPLCGRYKGVNMHLWQPGTLFYISGYDTKIAIQKWVKAVVKKFGPKQTVGIVEGVPTDSLHWKINQALKVIKKKYPQFKVVAIENTDYSAAQGYTAAQGLISAHPDLSVIMAPQSNITEGVARAVSQAGKKGKIKIADYGGDKAVVKLMKDGLVQLTVPTWPIFEAKKVMHALMRTARGLKVKRYVNPPFKVYTPGNVNKYHPQY